jgi:hypothetical protein
MRSFFGVREGDASAANNARYMPVGGAPGKPDVNNDEDKEAKALPMQLIEKSSWEMAADININLSRKPPPLSRVGSSRGGVWGSFMVLPKEEEQWQGEEQSQMSGDDL